MKRFIVRKYVMAESLAQALQMESKFPPEDGWVDDKQPEATMDAIGFQLIESDYYYSPVMKKKNVKKRKKKNC